MHPRAVPRSLSACVDSSKPPSVGVPLQGSAPAGSVPAVVLPWERVNGDPNTIRLIDGACAAQYPGQENCNTLGCPIGLYCTSRLTRQ